MELLLNPHILYTIQQQINKHNHFYHHASPSHIIHQSHTTHHKPLLYLLCLGELASIVGSHRHTSGEHLLAEDGDALLQVVLHVEFLGTQTASLRCSVEIRHLGE